ncbi:MAG TPA: hypothetical protein VFW31_17335 [Candidatus Angelobacter sp.]|nr:hypothetical protein [Candidatus Angelobacter sp.]
MTERLFVGVIGNRKAGKSTTWNTLFGRIVRTGDKTHKLELRTGEFVDVFLVSGSPEERRIYAGKILEKQTCRIVLCSMQYVPAVQQTLNYVFSKKFMIYLQWLNPGFSDPGETWDGLGIINHVLAQNGVAAIRDGHHVTKRVREIRDFLYGWASSRRLIYK